MTMPTDLEIARNAKLRRIEDIADGMGIPADDVEHYGREMAKISLAAIDRMGPPRAKYVLVTATSPTPLGEGKTTIAIGLAQGFKRSRHSETAIARTDIRYQGWSSRRWLLTGRSDGTDEPPPHR